MIKSVVMAMTISILVAASNVIGANTWKHEVAVTNVQSLPDGGFIIYGPAGTDAACQENGKLFHVRPNQNGQTIEGVKIALSIVLTAFSTGKTVTFLYDNASNYCYVQSVLAN